MKAVIQSVRRFFRNIRGAVTVFITILLIPAILVTGTAVDVSTIYAGKAVTRNANEMALNALLSDYNALLHDLYGLFAITADNEEMQFTVNAYLSLTLFHDEEASKGRILFNDMNYYANIQPIENATLQNKEILRRQIEEYVKLQAPAFLIEEVLDKIEHFTKFLPDLSAVIKKLFLDESIQLLYELYQQLYYRMRYHAWYLYDIDAKIENEPDALYFTQPQGVEVTMAKTMDSQLVRIDDYARKIQSAKNTYAARKQTYEDAAANSDDDEYIEKTWEAMVAAEEKFYDEIATAQSWVTDISQSQANKVYSDLSKGGKTSFGDWAMALTNTSHVVIDKWGFIGSIINKVNDTLWFTNPWEVIASIRTQQLSILSYEVTRIDKYLDNIENITILLALIEYHRSEVLKDIQTLLEHLDICSAALRGNDITGMRADVLKYEDIARNGIDAVGEQLAYIESTVTRNTHGTYFRRMGDYFSDPDIKINDGIQMTITQIADAFAVGLESENTDEFNILLSTNTVETIPYFTTLKEPDSPPAYTSFCDNDDVKVFFIFLYEKYGDDSYWMNELKELNEMVSVFFTTMLSGIGKSIKELAQGGVLDAAGASNIPSEVYAEMRHRENLTDGDIELADDIIATLAAVGTGQGDISGTIWNIINRCAKQLDMALKTYTSLSIFLETDGILNQFAMVTYDTAMFSCFTSQEGKSIRGYPYNRNVNYLLGWEQEYLLLGSPKESTCLAAASGMIFAARLVFNMISTFIVPTVNEFCMLDPEPITQCIARFIYAFGETYVDILQLRKGKQVPILKFLDDHWTFGNIGEMNKIIKKTISKPINNLMSLLLQSLNAATNPGLPQLKEIIDEIDVHKYYSASVTMSAYFRLQKRLDVNAATSSYWAGFADTIKDKTDEFINKADHIDDKIMEWKGYKKTTKDQEEIWEYKGVSVKDITNDITQAERLEKLNNNQESEILSSAGEKAAEKVIEGLWEVITPSASYQDYLTVFMFFTPPLALASRTQNLITINMTNVMQNSGETTPLVLDAALTVIPGVAVPELKYQDLPLSKKGLLDLTQAYTAFELTTTSEIKMLFMSSAFFRNAADSDPPPGTIAFNTISNRGY